MNFIKTNWIAILVGVVLIVWLLERYNASWEWKDKYNAASDSLAVVVPERDAALREADRLRDGQAYNEAILAELRNQLRDVRNRREEPIIIDETISDTRLADDLDSLLDTYRGRPTVRP